MHLHWTGFFLQLLPCVEQGQLKSCDPQLDDTEPAKQLVAEGFDQTTHKYVFQLMLIDLPPD